MKRNLQVILLPGRTSEMFQLADLDYFEEFQNLHGTKCNDKINKNIPKTIKNM